MMYSKKIANQFNIDKGNGIFYRDFPFRLISITDSTYSNEQLAPSLITGIRDNVFTELSSVISRAIEWFDSVHKALIAIRCWQANSPTPKVPRFY